MAWLFAGVVLLLLLFVPTFRIAVLVLLGILIVGGVIWFRQDLRELEESERRISLSEVDFIDLRLRHDHSRDYTLTGRIKNNSRRFTLKRLGMKFTMKDCIESSSASKDNCDIVGQTDESVYVDIPPGQVRDLSEYTFVHFPSSMVIKGHAQWSYSIKYLLAK